MTQAVKIITRLIIYIMIVLLVLFIVFNLYLITNIPVDNINMDNFNMDNFNSLSNPDNTFATNTPGIGIDPKMDSPYPIRRCPEC